MADATNTLIFTKPTFQILLAKLFCTGERERDVNNLFETEFETKPLCCTGRKNDYLAEIYHKLFRLWFYAQKLENIYEFRFPLCIRALKF